MCGRYRSNFAQGLSIVVSPLILAYQRCNFAATDTQQFFYNEHDLVPHIMGADNKVCKRAVPDASELCEDGAYIEKSCLAADKIVR